MKNTILLMLGALVWVSASAQRNGQAFFDRVTGTGNVTDQEFENALFYGETDVLRFNLGQDPDLASNEEVLLVYGEQLGVPFGTSARNIALMLRDETEALPWRSGSVKLEMLEYHRRTGRYHERGPGFGETVRVRKSDGKVIFAQSACGNAIPNGWSYWYDYSTGAVFSHRDGGDGSVVVPREPTNPITVRKPFCTNCGSDQHWPAHCTEGKDDDHSHDHGDVCPFCEKGKHAMMTCPDFMTFIAGLSGGGGGGSGSEVAVDFCTWEKCKDPIGHTIEAHVELGLTKEQKRERGQKLVIFLAGGATALLVEHGGKWLIKKIFGGRAGSGAGFPSGKSGGHDAYPRGNVAGGRSNQSGHNAFTNAADGSGSSFNRFVRPAGGAVRDIVYDGPGGTSSGN